MPTSTYIRKEDDHLFQEAASHADLIGRSWDMWATINSPELHAVEPADRPAVIQRWLHWLREWFRRHDEYLTYGYTREAEGKDSENEHVNILFHCPQRLRKKVKAAFNKRFGGKPAVVVKGCSSRVWWKRNGQRQAPQLYIAKGIFATRGKNQKRQYANCGTIHGLRLGVSDDLKLPSINAWRESRGMTTIKPYGGAPRG